MEVPYLLIAGVQVPFNGSTADFEGADAVPAVILERPLHLKDQLAHQFSHPFYHEHEVTPVLIHKRDVLFEEIPSAQNVSLFCAVFQEPQTIES